MQRNIHYGHHKEIRPSRRSHLRPGLGRDRFGIIDVNVNTAEIQGCLPHGPTDAADFARLSNTDVVGTFNVTSRTGAVMRDNEPEEDGERGVIVNTSLVAAESGPAICHAV